MEILEIKSLLSKAKPEVAAAIKAKCNHSEQDQLKQLLDNLLSLSNDIDDEEIIDWLSWIIAGGSTPEEFSSTVRLYDKATTCGLVWAENFVAYRCRTCGISPCMSLCTECFQHGNHEGHDFIIFRSETGGACDCGEINIIKESGCCSLHGPHSSHRQPPHGAARSRSDSTSSSNDQSAPVELLSIADGMMPRLFYRLLQSMRDEHRKRLDNPKLSNNLLMTCKHNVENNNEILTSILSKGHKFIKMLQGLSDMGVAMRQVMIHTLTKSHTYTSLVNQDQNGVLSPFKTFLEELVYWTVAFEFPEDLICLLLSMRSDSAYKEDFTRAFILQYKLISETILLSMDPEKLCKHVAAVSVQLFSIEQLAIKMVDQMNLLPLLVTTLHQMIDNAMIVFPPSGKKSGRSLVKAPPTKTLDCEHDIMKNNYYWPIKSDLKELLSHQPVAMKFFEDESLLRQWFQFLSHFQGMNMIKYIKKGLAHLEQETETHIGAFTAELEISATPMWTLLSHLREKSSAHLTKNIVQHCLQNLMIWSSSVNLHEKEISFHLPLHRNLSMFIRQGVLYQGFSLEELMPAKDQLGMIAQDLIRLQSAFYQIMGRLWSRNGTEVLNQAESYVNSLCCNSMIDADIFLLQAISGSVSSDKFLKLVFKEFALYESLGMKMKTQGESAEVAEILEGEEQNVMLESCMLFLATLTWSRTNREMSDENLMALEMSTLLCKGDKLHSELMELLPERCGTDSQLKSFEKVLAQVADYQAPRNMQQGKYVPKSIIWENFYDPIHTLLRSSNRAEFQVSMDRYLDYIKRSNKCSATSLWPPFRIQDHNHEGHVVGPFPDPKILLSSNTLLEILFILLFKAVHFGNVPNLTMSLVIYLLELGLCSNQNQNQDNFARDHVYEEDDTIFTGCDVGANLTKKVSMSVLQEKLSVKLATSSSLVNEESIISLLLQLHTQLKGGSGSYTLPLNANHTITTTESENRVGDGAHFVSNLLNKLSSRYPLVTSALMKETANQDVSNANESKFEKEREERRRKAKERKLQLMTEIAMKGQKFMKEMKEEVQQCESDSKEDFKTESSKDSEFECVICMEKGGSKVDNPFGLITYLTPSSVLSHRKIKDSGFNCFPLEKSFQQFWTSMCDEVAKTVDDSSTRLSFPVHFGNEISVQTCGHYLHLDCFNSYMSSLKKSKPKMNQRDPVLLNYRRFSCPLCRQLGNSFLPIIKDALGLGLTSELTEADDNELTRHLKRRSTLVLSPKQKQGVERFLEDLQKTVSFSRFTSTETLSSSGSSSGCSSSSSATTTSVAQTLSLVFLDAFEMESTMAKTPNGHLDVNRALILPLYSVLRYSYKSLSASHSKKLSLIWESIIGVKSSGSSSSSSSRGLREIPILLRDLNVLLSHFVLQLPYGSEHKYVDLLIQRLTSLKLVQILCGLCCQMDFADLNQVKNSICPPVESGSGGGFRLHSILYKIMECLLKSKSYESKQSQVDDLPGGNVSSLLRNLPELENFVALRMRPFSSKMAHLSSLLHSSISSSSKPSIEMDERPSTSRGSLKPKSTNGNDLSFISCGNFERNLHQWVDDLIQFNGNLQQLSMSHLIIWDVPKLIDLPHDYDRIFQTYRKVICENCNAVPSEPALCLLCRRIVCLNSFCCLDKQSKMSEVIQHSMECGMGNAVFLCVLSSAILIVEGKDACVWGSVYLDSFGEEDLDLKRGKPLFLCKDRFQFLQRQWKTHTFHKYELKWFPHDNML